MFFFRVMMMALRSLHTNMMRSLLAMLGVIIGVSAVVSAMSILAGAQKEVGARFESMGADQLLVFPGAARRHGRQTRVDTLKPEDVQAIERECDLIQAVAPEVMGPAQIKYLQKNEDAQVLATTPAYSIINDYEVAEGRFITREDDRGERKVCVLGYEVADNLFGPLPPLGRRVKINGKGFTIVGVMEKKGVLGFRQVDKQVIIPLSTGMKRMFGVRYVNMITCQTLDASKLKAGETQVKRALRGAHKIRADDQDDFQILNREQMKQGVADITKIFQVVLYSIAGISLVVGGIGIMNIMLVSVTERTREIGVRMAVGARRRDILTQFLIEAAVISIMGGALGVVMGMAFSDLLEQWTQVLETYTPMSAVINALVMAGVVGILSGIYPAYRASRLDPVEALGFE